MEAPTPRPTGAAFPVAESAPMDMAFAFLADHAAVPPDGKLYVLGGGINMLGIPQIPGRAAFDVVGGFRFSPADAQSVHIVDAFSGDTIPLHLLTREALRIYLRQTRLRRLAGVSNQQPLLRPSSGPGRRWHTTLEWCVC